MKKIAVLRSEDDSYSYQFLDLEIICKQYCIELKSFRTSEPILNFNPDCVIVTSPQHAKLTPFPTYGLINLPRDEYLGRPRFLRNILTYDGYLLNSPRLKMMLGDLVFGARKLNTKFCDFTLCPNDQAYLERSFDVNAPSAFIFEPDFANSKFKSAIYSILEEIKDVCVVTYSIGEIQKFNDRFHAIASQNELNDLLSKTPIAVVLEGGDEQEEYMSTDVIKLAMSSAFVLTHETTLVKKTYDDSLHYFSGKLQIKDLINVLKEKINWIKKNTTDANVMSQRAHKITSDNYSQEKNFQAFLQYHEETLVNKGYRPNPDASIEAELPSVTYIMRTGGKHRPFLERALNCLASQNYPDLRVIFVTHVKVPFLNEIIDAYPTIKFKILERIKSRRSEAIRDGMAAVETDLFGLFDDDDELFPNHVRSLVKTMQYHSGRDWRGEIGMVYSGSIHADDTYPVYERVEFHDDKLVNRNEKRAMEHFRYYSSHLMSQHEWFMPNGWLARASLIDEEILNDPGLDTCEDLYFELQIAQRRQMAFSVEVTAIHHFHHLGNSTIDDSHKHIPDTQRIALRNFSRTFPSDSLYDTGYNIVGRASQHDPNQIHYQDMVEANRYESRINQFYPYRHRRSIAFEGGATAQLFNTSAKQLINPFRVFKFAAKVYHMDKYKRDFYIDKFKKNLKYYGFLSTIHKTIDFLVNGEGRVIGLTPNHGKMKSSILSRKLSKFFQLITFGVFSRTSNSDVT